jgi:tripartite ATP-independent transporter DctM subunit
MDPEILLPVGMFVALIVLLFAGYPVAFVLGGVGLFAGFFAWAIDPWLFDPIQFYNIPQRIWGGVAENLVLVAVPMFVFMGTMLEKSGIGQDLLHCLQVVLRRVPGGLALAVTLMGTILAATTGIIGASVVMMTMLALPIMLDRRYDPAFASGTIAASSTLGILIPPSIMLVVVADLLSRSVGYLFVAALVPGLLLAALYIGYIVLFCGLRPDVAPPLEADEGPETRSGLALLVLRSFVPPILLIFLVLGSIIFGWATPTEASAVGAGGAIALALVKRKLDWQTLIDVLDRVAVTVAMIFTIFLGATAFSYVFRVLGGDLVIEGLIDGVGLGSWGVLLALMALVFVLGFFLDWIEITLIVIPIFTPIFALLDFSPHVEGTATIYWIAILLAVNLQTCFLTPPFGFALFYMKGAAGTAVPMQTIYRGIVPFVVLQLIGLGLVIAFPGIALWLPERLID